MATATATAPATAPATTSITTEICGVDSDFMSYSEKANDCIEPFLRISTDPRFGSSSSIAAVNCLNLPVMFITTVSR